MVKHGQKSTFKHLKRKGSISRLCLQWGRARFLLLVSVSPAPQNQVGLLLAELRAVALFALCAIPEARVAVTWLGIELLVT